MQHAAPRGDGFVRGEYHRAAAFVAIVHDVEEHVRGIGAVGEIADLVDDEEARVGVARERLGEAALAEGGREIIDEFRGGHEVGVEAVLDRAIGDCDREVRLAAPGFAVQDQRAALGDEVRGERGAEQGEAHGRLVGEIEVVDRFEEREAGAPREPREARLLAVGDLLGDEDGQEAIVGPLLSLGAGDEVAPHASRVGEIEALEDGIEFEVGGVDRGPSRGGASHSTSSCGRPPDECAASREGVRDRVR